MMWHSPYNWLEVEQLADVTVVKFITRAILGDNTIRIIGDEMFRLVEAQGRRKLLLNFQDVKNCGSYMLATLLNLNKKIEAAGGRLVLCSIDAELYRVFELTQLHKIFHIYPDEAEGLRSFSD